MGFKVLKVTMSPSSSKIHISWSGKKGKLSSFCISFLVLYKTCRTYDLKLNVLLIFYNSLGSCSDLMSHGFKCCRSRFCSVFAELAPICQCVEVSGPQT